jgi:ABC-type Fe3+ transport system permease subunit
MKAIGLLALYAPAVTIAVILFATLRRAHQRTSAPEHVRPQPPAEPDSRTQSPGIVGLAVLSVLWLVVVLLAVAIL